MYKCTYEMVNASTSLGLSFLMKMSLITMNFLLVAHIFACIMWLWAWFVKWNGQVIKTNSLFFFFFVFFSFFFIPCIYLFCIILFCYFFVQFILLWSKQTRAEDMLYIYIALVISSIHVFYVDTSWRSIS